MMKRVLVFEAKQKTKKKRREREGDIERRMREEKGLDRCTDEESNLRSNALLECGMRVLIF